MVRAPESQRDGQHHDRIVHLHVARQVARIQVAPARYHDSYRYTVQKLIEDREDDWLGYFFEECAHGLCIRQQLVEEDHEKEREENNVLTVLDLGTLKSVLCLRVRLLIVLCVVLLSLPQLNKLSTLTSLLAVVDDLNLS